MTRLSVGILGCVSLLYGCQGSGHLVIDENSLEAGKRGHVTASFTPAQDVFRKPYGTSMASAGELRINLLSHPYPDDPAAGAEAQPVNLSFGGNDVGFGASPEFVRVETVDRDTFSFDVDVPADFGAGPYELHVGVRLGEAGEPGWPTFGDVVEVASAANSAK